MINEIESHAVKVYPSERQAKFMENPFYAFVHFSPNTYTGKEWGDGREDPAVFNPTELDCDQWVKAIKSAGMTGMVLTAKHHDGFCLWPSRYTEHSVKHSPWKNGKGDVVREAAEACRRGGIRFGFYLSPWDRNNPAYGSSKYNEYYKNQLTELLTEYGDIFYVWFDGACGEGPNGRKQEYDYEGYIELIRKYQPNACIFNDAGPDIRWIGNECGTARNEEWSVVPHELCHLATIQQMIAPKGSLLGINNMWKDLGSISILKYSAGLSFCPAEIDMSIRPGWFYHQNEDPHSVERLLQTYITSVGGNACFNLNIPPMPNGKFNERDINRLKELGDAIYNIFRTEIAIEIRYIKLNDTQSEYEIILPGVTEYSCVELSENMTMGQRVERFQLLADNSIIFDGTTIGFRRLCLLGKHMGSEIKLRIVAARDQADIHIRLFE